MRATEAPAVRRFQAIGVAPALRACTSRGAPLRSRFSPVLHVVVVALLLIQSGTVRGQRSDVSPSIRSGLAEIRHLLREGSERSATFAGLVQRLEQTDGMVYVEEGSCPLAGIPGCLLHWVNDVGGRRYLRIHLRLRLAPRDRLIATRGHELQHVLEVLSAPDVRTPAAVRSLFMRIGWNIGRGSGETKDAVRVGELVAGDLARNKVTGVAWK